MKSLVRNTLLIIFVLTCATANFAQSQSTPTDKPAPEQVASQISTEAEANAGGSSETQASKATIYFYRIKQFVGSALEPSVYCDDKELARMDNGRFFGVTLDPGVHTCRMGDKQTGFELDMKAGQSYYAKVTLEAGFWKGHGRLTFIQPEQGAFEIKKTKPLGTSKIKDRSLVTIFEGGDKK